MNLLLEKQQLIKRALVSEKNIQKGETTSLKKLRKEIRNWKGQKDCGSRPQ